LGVDRWEYLGRRPPRERWRINCTVRQEMGQDIAGVRVARLPATMVLRRLPPTGHQFIGAAWHPPTPAEANIEWPLLALPRVAKQLLLKTGRPLDYCAQACGQLVVGKRLQSRLAGSGAVDTARVQDIEELGTGRRCGA
jgi:hypothetical protein